MDEETMKKYIEQGVTSLSGMEMLENAKGMKPLRCSKCDKLLGMIEGKAEIKCPKCKTMNKTRTLDEYVEAMLSKETTKAVRDAMALTDEDIQNIRDQVKSKVLNFDDTDAWTDKFKVVYSTDKDNWRGVEKPEVIEMEIRCLQGVEPPPINHEWATTNGLGANKKTYKLLQIISQENVQGINYNHDDDKFEPTIWTEYKCKVELIK